MDDSITLERHEAAPADVTRVDTALDTSKGAAVGALVGIILPLLLQEAFLFLAIPAAGAILGGVGGMLIGRNKRAGQHRSLSD